MAEESEVEMPADLNEAWWQIPNQYSRPAIEKGNFKTAPFDSRFPNQNQTRNCWQNYVDFFRCLKVKKAKNSDPFPCLYFKDIATIMCPREWIEKWNDQMSAGTFPGKV